MKHRFVQVTPKGIWVSRGVFDEAFETIAANVTRGHVLGQPRAAISAEDNTVIFALDASARVMHPRDFLFDHSLVA
jgi:hypothetical protein